MTDDLKRQTAKLEAIKALEDVNHSVLRKLTNAAGVPVDIRVEEALEWSLEQLAITRPADPVDGLASLLRRYEAEVRKSALGMNTGASKRYT